LNLAGGDECLAGISSNDASSDEAVTATAASQPFELPVPELGAWRGGNTGVEGVWRFDSGLPGRQVMVTALVHGNELCGAWALLRLLQQLDSGLRPRQGALTLAFCNLAAFDRFDPQRPDASRFVDEDMNRVWGPGLVAEDARRSSERDRALQLLPFVEQADWLLDLHSMHEPGEPLLLTGLQPRNRALARQLRAPRCVVSDAGHRDGRRMRDHGRFGRIERGARDDDGTRSLLIECGYHGELASRDVATDMAGRFLVASGALQHADIPPGWRREQPAGQQFLQVTGAVVAATPDLRFAEPWVNGQHIARTGTLLGWDGGRPFVTPADDCTVVMPSLRQLRVGVTVMRLARPLDEDAASWS
jgi:predicted deacylase